MVHTPYHSDFVTVCWFLYLIRTADNRLYTGITTDVPRRFRQHQAGKGAKALRGKGDLQLAFSHEVGEHSLALRLEYRVKQLTKREKERLVAGEDALVEVEAGVDEYFVSVTAADAVPILRYCAGLSQLDAAQLAAADLTGDGAVTSGLVCAHHHLYSTLARGMPPPPRTPTTCCWTDRGPIAWSTSAASGSTSPSAGLRRRRWSFSSTPPRAAGSIGGGCCRC